MHDSDVLRDGSLFDVRDLVISVSDRLVLLYDLTIYSDDESLSDRVHNELVKLISEQLFVCVERLDRVQNVRCKKVVSSDEVIIE